MNVDKRLDHASRIVLAALLAVVLMGVIAVSDAHAVTAAVTAATT